MVCPLCNGKDEIGDILQWEVMTGKHKGKIAAYVVCYACEYHGIELIGESLLIDLPDGLDVVAR
jgi:hypothetical protein